MKYDETTRMTEARLQEARQLGLKLALLRKALGVTQAHAAERAGVSRSTAVLIESGDASRTLAQILRYLEVLAPGYSLLALLTDDIPAIKNFREHVIPARVRNTGPMHSHTSHVGLKRGEVRGGVDALKNRTREETEAERLRLAKTMAKEKKLSDYDF